MKVKGPKRSYGSPGSLKSSFSFMCVHKFGLGDINVWMLDSINVWMLDRRLVC